MPNPPFLASYQTRGTGYKSCGGTYNPSLPQLPRHPPKKNVEPFPLYKVIFISYHVIMEKKTHCNLIYGLG